jgi:hypothetical protein
MQLPAALFACQQFSFSMPAPVGKKCSAFLIRQNSMLRERNVR